MSAANVGAATGDSQGLGSATLWAIEKFAEEEQEPQDENKEQSWRLAPSVGTWLMKPAAVSNSTGKPNSTPRKEKTKANPVASAPGKSPARAKQASPQSEQRRSPRRTSPPTLPQASSTTVVGATVAAASKALRPSQAALLKTDPSPKKAAASRASPRLTTSTARPSLTPRTPGIIDEPTLSPEAFAAIAAGVIPPLPLQPTVKEEEEEDKPTAATSVIEVSISTPPKQEASPLKFETKTEADARVPSTSKEDSLPTSSPPVRAPRAKSASRAKSPPAVKPSPKRAAAHVPAELEEASPLKFETKTEADSRVLSTLGSSSKEDSPPKSPAPVRAPRAKSASRAKSPPAVKPVPKRAAAHVPRVALATNSTTRSLSSTELEVQQIEEMKRQAKALAAKNARHMVRAVSSKAIFASASSGIGSTPASPEAAPVQARPTPRRPSPVRRTVATASGEDKQPVPSKSSSKEHLVTAAAKIRAAAVSTPTPTKNASIAQPKRPSAPAVNATATKARATSATLSSSKSAGTIPVKATSQLQGTADANASDSRECIEGHSESAAAESQRPSTVEAVADSTAAQ